jgi:hypothetical protein
MGSWVAFLIAFLCVTITVSVAFAVVKIVRAITSKKKNKS